MCPGSGPNEVPSRHIRIYTHTLTKSLAEGLGAPPREPLRLLGPGEIDLREWKRSREPGGGGRQVARKTGFLRRTLVEIELFHIFIYAIGPRVCRSSAAALPAAVAVLRSLGEVLRRSFCCFLRFKTFFSSSGFATFS